MSFIFGTLFGGALLLILICLFIAYVGAIQDHHLGRRSMPLIAATISLLWILDSFGVTHSDRTIHRSGTP